MAEYLQTRGIRFIAFRNEQASSYAAAYYSYLIGRAAVLMTTSGPGLLHALPGIACAKFNGWPLLVISSTYNANPKDQERFQETSHDAINDFVIKRENGINIKELYNEAQIQSAPVFLELDFDLIERNQKVSSSFLIQQKEIKLLSLSSHEQALKERSFPFVVNDTYQRPLVIVGVEAIFKEKEDSICSFIKNHQIPFILMPMAKGSIDISELNVNASRTLALNESDLIIVFGSSSNWMLPLHKLPQNPKIIMLSRSFVNLSEGEPFYSLYSSVMDIDLLKELKLQMDKNWIIKLLDNCRVNEEIQRSKCLDESVFSYHAVYHILTPFITENTVLVVEGSRTMDIARILLPSFGSKKRLDAGQLAGMGMGLPAILSARLRYPHDSIYCVIGDSAIGFSQSEIETIVRYKMSNITIIVMNNSGIYQGIDSDSYNSLNERDQPIPTTVLYPKFRFDKLADLFDPVDMNYRIKGFHVTNRKELEQSLNDHVFSLKIINCVIE